MIQVGQILKNHNIYNSEIKIIDIKGEEIIYKYINSDALYSRTESRLKDNGYIIPEEKWKPKGGDIYWCIYSDGSIDFEKWIGAGIDNEYYAFGNCFKTEAEAIKARDAIKALLSSLHLQN